MLSVLLLRNSSCLRRSLKYTICPPTHTLSFSQRFKIKQSIIALYRQTFLCIVEVCGYGKLAFETLLEGGKVFNHSGLTAGPQRNWARGRGPLLFCVSELHRGHLQAPELPVEASILAACPECVCLVIRVGEGGFTSSPRPKVFSGMKRNPSGLKS